MGSAGPNQTPSPEHNAGPLLIPLRTQVKTEALRGWKWANTVTERKKM